MTDDQSAQARLRQVFAELTARTPEDRMQPRLDPVRECLELLGDPHLAYPVIHVAGTNGKSSTARIVDRLLREHHLRVGRFTSPHLTSVTERISVDGEPISAERFAEVHEDVAPYVAMVDGRLRSAGEVPLTYFEVLAVMGFAAFADAPVDVAVVEVGLGGTWDATNVVRPQVAVITPISLDHTAVLGDTLEEIAAEKAGIVKEGAVVVSATQPEAAAAVVLQRCADVGVRVAREGVDFGVESRQVAVGGQLVSLQGVAGRYEELALPLHGEHQARNAAVAVAAVEAFIGGGDGPLEPDVVRTALADVDSPGRLEVLRPSPTILVDAAHNPAGTAALVAAVEEEFAFAELVGVVGVLADKDAGTMLELLEPVLDEIVVTRSASPRSVAVDELAALAEEIFGEDRVHAVERLDDALQLAVDRSESRAKDGLGAGVLVTGSVTVVGEARALLVRERRR
ncbi:MAG: bifunctional folylpolyglutamate synthase/dihydrofolate synthase [Actinomycetes bacterium]